MSARITQPCPICPHRCLVSENTRGVCGVRTLKGDTVVSLNYGQVSALSLDPIEKKPLACYHPGSMILSVGSYGCNLACPFCQNHEIAFARPNAPVPTFFLSPQQLVDQALEERTRGNIGIAFTYNEPFISWEYMRDCSELAHEEALSTVAVTNAYVQPEIWQKSLSFIDAFNIDLKCFSDEGYKKLGAPHGLEVVKASIRSAVESGAHVELTKLVVPGISDDEELFEHECDWIASLDENIPFHISRFFPTFKMSGEAPTDRGLIDRFLEIADRRLTRVFLGNV